MTTPPAAPPVRSGARFALLGLVAAGLLGAFFLDPIVFETVSAKTAEQEASLAESDAYRFFRILGYFPTWLAVGLALFAIDLSRREPHTQPLRRATLLILVTAVAGLAAEIVKLLTRRGRPSADGVSAFFSAGDGLLSTSGLAFPSSHAAVAFGAAFALSFIHPRVAPVLLLLAACCGMTRIAAGAHHFSDVYAAMLVSYFAARAIFAWDLRNNASPPA